MNDGAPGLFEPTEGRGPLAPPGVPFVWGVDVSSLRVSIAVESDELEDEAGRHTIRAVFTKSFTRPGARNVGERLALIHNETYRFAQQLAPRYPPEQVSVESPAMNPGGGGAEPILEYATGTIAAALSCALAVPVWMVPVGRWKARAVGHGHATKAQCLVWAHDEFGATIEDEADASGVARAARLTVWGGLHDEKDIARGAVPRG